MKYTNKLIKFDKISNKLELILIKELLILIKNNFKYINHIFIVGLGNDNYKADSIGPYCLKNININYFNNKIKVSSLEPGVLKETGISTLKIVKSVVREIKPDLIILIDSFLCNNLNDLNKSIIINNYGITSNMGILGLNDSLNRENLNCMVIAIGIPSALELYHDKINYILSTKDIDKYILDISKLIGNVINKVISYL